MCNERNRQVWEKVNIDKQPRGHLQLGANGNDANADRQTEKGVEQLTLGSDSQRGAGLTHETGAGVIVTFLCDEKDL